MADKPTKRLVDEDIVQIEFLIDDLVKRLIPDRILPIASCNGCKGCRAAVDLPVLTDGRP